MESLLGNCSTSMKLWFEDLLDFIVKVEDYEVENGPIDLPLLPKEMYTVLHNTLKPDKDMYEGLMQKIGHLGKQKTKPIESMGSSPISFRLNGNSFITSTPVQKRKPTSTTPSILHKPFPDDSNYNQYSPAKTMEWAKTPKVKQLLQDQQNIDPELIFGRLNPVVTMQSIYY